MKILSCLLNVRSIVKNKLFLEAFVSKYKLDLLFITETWLKTADVDSVVLGNLFKTYNIYRSDRFRKKGGGVAILVRNVFPFVVHLRLHEPDSFELLAGDFCIDTCKIRIIVVYRAPSCNSVGSTKLVDTLSDLLSSTVPCILAGDFNFPDIDWSKPNPSCGSNVSQCFLDFCTSCDLNQFVSHYTRGSNVLDIILSNASDLIDNVSITAPLGNSDHNSVLFDVCCKYSEPMRARRKVYGQADYDAINAYLYSVPWMVIFRGIASVDSLYESFLKILSDCVEKFIPTKLVNVNCKYLPSYLVKMVHYRHLLWRSARQQNNLDKWEEYRKYSDDLAKKLKKFNKSVEKKVLASDDRNVLYKYISEKMSTSRGLTCLKEPNGALLVDDLAKAELLADSFSKVFTVDDGCSPIYHSNVMYPQEVPSFILAIDIVRYLKSWPSSYSITPDNIPFVFLKNTAEVLCHPLEYIYNRSLMSSEIPSRWRHSYVSPIPKKEPLTDPSNYRPVSLTSLLCRLFEKHMLKEMNTHIMRNQLIPSAQHGFRKGMSCETQMIEVLNDWTFALDNGSYVDVMYLDFSKAFDKVTHVKLLFKLRAMKFHPLLVNWITNFLSGRTFQVRVGSALSTQRVVSSGVPQGGVLSPTLFNLYTAEVPTLFDDLNVSCKIYADDSKLYQCLNDSSDSKLQEALNRIIGWAKIWQLPLSAEKTQVLYLGGSKNPHTLYEANGAILEAVEEDSHVRDLGYLITPDLSFEKHCKMLVARANHMLYNIFKVITTKNQTLLIRAYKTYVRPILESGTCVYNSIRKRDVIRIEKIQDNFTRKLFIRLAGIRHCRRGPRSGERNRIYGFDTLEKRRKINDMKMMYKLYSGKHWKNIDDFYNVTRAHTRRGNTRIQWPRAKTSLRSKSFIIRGGEMFNLHSRLFHKCNSLEQFSAKLFK